MEEWPGYTSVHMVQWILRFASFFQRFIQNHIYFAVPLSALTKTSPKGFFWSDKAQKAIYNIKERLPMAPVLHMPDPQGQLKVEVDASNIGVEAVLSQRSSAD